MTGPDSRDPQVVRITKFISRAVHVLYNAPRRTKTQNQQNIGVRIALPGHRRTAWGRVALRVVRTRTFCQSKSFCPARCQCKKQTQRTSRVTGLGSLSRLGIAITSGDSTPCPATGAEALRCPCQSRGFFPNKVHDTRAIYF